MPDRPKLDRMGLLAAFALPGYCIYKSLRDKKYREAYDDIDVAMLEIPKAYALYVAVAFAPHMHKIVFGPQ
jgi:hypothetical protein